MKTHKKRPTRGGGWIAAVTLDNGEVLTVELTEGARLTTQKTPPRNSGGGAHSPLGIRGRVARHYFGNPSHHWSARVHGPGWRHTLVANRDDSGRKLALRAVQARAELDA